MSTVSSARHLVIVGCSARKLNTTTPAAALDLYQGWCVPQLRAHVRGHPQPRADILVLSAKHGLIPADTPLLPYDQPLTPRRVADLRAEVHRAWMQQWRSAAVGELLLLIEPAYLELIGPSLLSHPPAAVHWIPDPGQAWERAAAVLDRWGRLPAPGIDANERNPR